MRKTNIKIKGYAGTWYVIDEMNYRDDRITTKLYLLESESYGDEIPCLIVNSDLDIILDNVMYGFDELFY